MDQYSPAEKLEAQDKKETQERGRNEAVLYKIFLENLRKLVDSKLNPNLEPGDLDSKLIHSQKRLLSVFPQHVLQEIIKKAMNEALDSKTVKDFKEDVKMRASAEKLQYSLSTINFMTFDEFFKYIDSLKSSLIK